MSLVGTARRARFRSRIARAPLVAVRRRGLRPEDALLVSYPRSGTTWLRFLLTEALTGETADFHPDRQAVRYVGEHADAPAILPSGGRLIFSHERPSRDRRTVLYIVRDPRAVALSEWRWLRRRGLADPTFDRFLDRFVRGRSNPWGAWADHVDRWTVASEAARAGRLTLTRFEDLRADTAATLAGLVASLGATVDAGRLREVVAANSLERMQDKESAAPDRAFAKGVQRDVRFVSTGSVAGWRRALSEAQQRAIADAFGDVMRRLGYDPAPTTSEADAPQRAE
ncbi:MAG TPA: sulfotransferase domain-containing protein [Actinomycetota bacterium]